MDTGIRRYDDKVVFPGMTTIHLPGESRDPHRQAIFPVKTGIRRRIARLPGVRRDPLDS